MHWVCLSGRWNRKNIIFQRKKLSYITTRFLQHMQKNKLIKIQGKFSHCTEIIIYIIWFFFCGVNCSISKTYKSFIDFARILPPYFPIPIDNSTSFNHQILNTSNQKPMSQIFFVIRSIAWCFNGSINLIFFESVQTIIFL